MEGDDDALHRPVYTVRHIDPTAGWIEFDVFRHLGGRTSKWAETASPDDVVGILELGRGKLIQRSRWLIAGDEAAFPAIARLLEAQAENTTGSVFSSKPCRDLRSIRLLFRQGAA